MELDEGLLGDLFATLRENDYAQLQYVPTRKSALGFFKEGHNLRNWGMRKKHLMFSYSASPAFYLHKIFSMNRNLRFFFFFCFLNEPAASETIKEMLGERWLRGALQCGLVVKEEGEGCFLALSVLPIADSLILRDYHPTYRYHEYDEHRPPNRIYVGADSIKFAECNQKYLGGNRFQSVLELGCGTGIQLLSLQNIADYLVGVDANPRAVEFTRMTLKLNGLQERSSVVQSNLFENVDRAFDLIVANPWFIDLEKGGLEEIPEILLKVDDYLQDGGTFAMYLGSYVKDGVDLGKSVLETFAEERKYDATFYRLGKSIEPEKVEEYRRLRIECINSYYAILRKGGAGEVTTHGPTIMRRIRDQLYLPMQRKLARLGVSSLPPFSITPGEMVGREPRRQPSNSHEQ